MCHDRTGYCGACRVLQRRARVLQRTVRQGGVLADSAAGLSGARSGCRGRGRCCARVARDLQTASSCWWVWPLALLLHVWNCLELRARPCHPLLLAA